MLLDDALFPCVCVSYYCYTYIHIIVVQLRNNNYYYYNYKYWHAPQDGNTNKMFYIYKTPRA